ncbi:MAG: NAD(P)H-hydrate dehydratase [Synergistaceae bacterium]|nr:NAD(P)H-hydrate dehydratase [Candidatus Equadaptatus faecalis]
MNAEEYGKEKLRGMLPEIPSDIHKGNRGGVLVCGGSLCYRGAPLLAALGALRAGAGYVVLAVPDFMAESASVFLPEAIIAPVKTLNGSLSADSLARTVKLWEKRCAAAVFGPGTGRDERLRKTLEKFMSIWSKPLLLDADALWFLSETRPSARDNLAVSPHAGEAAHLLSETPEAVQADRQAAAEKLSQKYGAALLKGKGTLVACGSEMRVINAGSPALAVPGSGDVLSGVVGAFCASGMSIFNALTAGALVHALAGERLEAKYGLRGALAREIAEEIPLVLK